MSSVHVLTTTIKALCLAPSRELARQIMSVVVAMGKFTNVQTEYAIKDNLPRNATNITAHVIVGTPGTMTDLIRRKVSFFTLSNWMNVFKWRDIFRSLT